MLTTEGLKLIEFNARLGDPEAQCLLPRLHSDLLPALMAACDGALDAFDLRWKPDASVAVVLASRGYPGGTESSAIPSLESAAAMPGVQVFQGATALHDGALVAAGGRVLTVTATAADPEAARAAAYRAVDAIGWAGGFCRRDIGLVSDPHEP
jgi:phosphoribosylamine---glycine ligase